jgi:hypothetical protein
MRAAFVESIREGGSFWMNLSVTADAVPPPLSRGGFGISESFPSSPEALPLGELSPKVTERVKTFRRIKRKNIGKTVDIPDENGYYITVARPTQG